MIDKMLKRLSQSEFRNSFHLKSKDFDYINKVGLDKIKEHAYDFIRKRLAPKDIFNDGKQTPTHKFLLRSMRLRLAVEDVYISGIT